MPQSPMLTLPRAAAFLCLLGAAVPVAAQTGDTEATALPGRSVTTALSAIQGYDQNVLQTVPLLSPAFSRGGFFTGAEVDAGLVQRSRHVTFSVNGRANARYFPTLASSVLNRYAGSGSLQSQLTAHTRLTLSGTADHRRDYRAGAASELTGFDVLKVTLPGFGESIAQVPANELTARGELEQQVTKHGTLAVTALQGRLTYDGNDDYRLKTRSGGLRWRQMITQKLGWTAGYQYADWNAGRLGASHVQNVGGGVVYAGNVSPNTELAVSTGFAVVQFAGMDEKELMATGDASVRHRFTRLWSGMAQFTRGVRYIELSAAPLAFNKVSAGTTRSLGTATSATVMAGYTHGHTSLLPTTQPYNQIDVEARVVREFSGRFAGFASYRLYGYDFTEAALLPVGVPNVLKRNAFSVGVTLRTDRRLP